MVDKQAIDASKIQNFKLVDQKYYIKNHKLGKGNFAETWLAVMKDDETKLLACKMIQKQDIIEKLKHASNPEQRKEYIINSLKNEVQLWKQIDHTNIIKFFDFSETSNNIYLFLEYAPDGDLEKYMKDKALPIKQAYSFMRQIADAMNELAENKIQHRDIKPENILISGDQIKMADFGFAKKLDQEDPEFKAKQTSVGTPYYMAPQILGGLEYSIKCDVWSCGVMFFQMVSGMLPWTEANSIADLYKSIKEVRPKYPKSNSSITTPIKELINNMLQVDEEKRLSISQVFEKLFSDDFNDLKDDKMKSDDLKRTKKE